MSEKEKWYIIKLKNNEEFLVTKRQYDNLKKMFMLPKESRPEIVNIGDDESIAVNFIASIRPE